MLIAFFSWWYGEGWQRQLSMVTTRVAGLIDLFSLDLLIRTLFAPFRQISAQRIDGPAAAQLQAFIDKTISRCIGALIRTAVLLTGCITLVVVSAFAVLYVLLWPLIPLMPAIGLVLTLSGWLPWR